MRCNNIKNLNSSVLLCIVLLACGFLLDVFSTGRIVSGTDVMYCALITEYVLFMNLFALEDI